MVHFSSFTEILSYNICKIKVYTWWLDTHIYCKMFSTVRLTPPFSPLLSSPLLSHNYHCVCVCLCVCSDNSDILPHVLWWLISPKRSYSGKHLKCMAVISTCSLNWTCLTGLCFCVFIFFSLLNTNSENKCRLYWGFLHLQKKTTTLK